MPIATNPVATGIEAEVCADIAQRQAHGINKYGTTVADNPLELRAWLQHAYEESLDLPIYLKRAIAEIDNKANEARAMADVAYSSARQAKIAEYNRDIERLEKMRNAVVSDKGTTPYVRRLDREIGWLKESRDSLISLVKQPTAPTEGTN